MKASTTLQQLVNKCIFDTSAVNALLDDPDRARIIQGLGGFTVLPTVVAVSEIAATPEDERRHQLLRLLKEIGQNNVPLAAPNKMIIRLCVAYRERDPSPTLNDGEEERAAWSVLNRPEQVNAMLAEVARNYHEEQEATFRVVYEEMRKQLEPAARSGERPRNVKELIQRIEGRAVFAFVNAIYNRATGHDLPETELQRLLNTVPQWPMFLLGYACALYQRSVQEFNFGHRKKPGQFDLWSATYLPCCNYFVTDDRRQRRALIRANSHGTRRASVLAYREFRKRLL